MTRAPSEPEQRQTREEEALHLADSILANIELDQLALDKVILKTARFSRLVEDADMQTWMNFEINGYPDTDEARQWMRRTRRIPPPPAKAIFSSGLTLAQAIESSTRVVASARIPDISGEYALVALNKAHKFLTDMEGGLFNFRQINAGIIALIHSHVVAHYHRLRFSSRQHSMFSSARERIDGLLAEIGSDAIAKIDSAYERVLRGDPESISQGLSSCRRLIDQSANTLFPPTDQPRVVSNQPFELGEAQVLNRLKAYVDDNTVSKSRRTRLKQGITNLYARASSGVHSDVTVEEARYLFLDTYVLLGELISMRSDN